MSDDRNKQDGPDRNQVAGGEDYEVNYIAEKLNVTKDASGKPLKL